MKLFNPLGYGWGVAFYCMGQFFIGPLITLNTVVETITALKQNVEVYERYPEIRNFDILNMLIALAISVYGIVTAIYLYKIKHWALKITRQYLLVVMCYSCISGFSPLLFRGLPQNLQNSLLDLQLNGAIKSLIISGLWYAYFIKSKRVKNTYLS